MPDVSRVAWIRFCRLNFVISTFAAGTDNKRLCVSRITRPDRQIQARWPLSANLGDLERKILFAGCFKRLPNSLNSMIMSVTPAPRSSSASQSYSAYSHTIVELTWAANSPIWEHLGADDVPWTRTNMAGLNSGKTNLGVGERQEVVQLPHLVRRCFHLVKKRFPLAHSVRPPSFKNADTSRTAKLSGFIRKTNQSLIFGKPRWVGCALRRLILADRNLASWDTCWFGSLCRNVSHLYNRFLRVLLFHVTVIPFACCKLPSSNLIGYNNL
jgi:hypothetical protein